MPATVALSINANAYNDLFKQRALWGWLGLEIFVVRASGRLAEVAGDRTGGEMKRPELLWLPLVSGL